MSAAIARQPERLCDGEFGTPSVTKCFERPNGAPGSEGSAIVSDVPMLPVCGDCRDGHEPPLMSGLVYWRRAEPEYPSLAMLEGVHGELFRPVSHGNSSLLEGADHVGIGDAERSRDDPGDEAGTRSALRLRIPMIPYTQSDVFVRGRRRPRSGRRLGPYPVSSPPSRCLIDSLQALKLAVERVEISR